MRCRAVVNHSGRLTKAPKAIRFRHGRLLAALGRVREVEVTDFDVEQYRDLLSQEPLKEEYQKSVTAALTKLIDVIITAGSRRGAAVRSRRTHPV